ncbi:MAG: hypothetical protein Q9199_004806 [Rusavskia elegans]
MNLPPETSLLILSYLPTKDIKSARLVCRNMASMGARYLIETLYISHRKEDTEVFTAVTRHGGIRKSVRNIVYDSAHFQDLNMHFYFQALHEQFIHFGKWFPEAENLVRETSLRSYSSGRPNRVLEGFQQYSRMVQEESTIHDKSWLSTIHEGLQLLGPVDTITIGNSWNMGWINFGKTDKDKDFHEKDGNILRKTGSPVTRRWLLITLTPSSRSVGDASYGSEFPEIVQFLRAVNKRPRVFNAPASLSPDLFNVCSATNNYFLDMIDRLVVLRLDFQAPIDRHDNPTSIIPELGLLTSALRNSSSLEELLLLIPVREETILGGEPECFFPYRRSHVLPSATVWRSPKLRRLTLGGLSFSYKDLVGLLFLSLPSLCHLRLHGISLTDGYWADIVQGLQYRDQLQSCFFKGPFRSHGPWFWTDQPDVLSHSPTDFMPEDPYPDEETENEWMERLNAVFYTIRSAYRDFMGPQDDMHGMEEGSVQMEFEGDLHL